MHETRVNQITSTQTQWFTIHLQLRFQSSEGAEGQQSASANPTPLFIIWKVNQLQERTIRNAALLVNTGTEKWWKLISRNVPINSMLEFNQKLNSGGAGGMHIVVSCFSKIWMKFGRYRFCRLGHVNCKLDGIFLLPFSRHTFVKSATEPRKKKEKMKWNDMKEWLVFDPSLQRWQPFWIPNFNNISKIFNVACNFSCITGAADWKQKATGERLSDSLLIWLIDWLIDWFNSVGNRCSRSYLPMEMWNEFMKLPVNRL